MRHSKLTDKATGVLATNPELDKAQIGYQALLNGFRSIQMGTVNQEGMPEASYSPAVIDDERNFYVHVSELSSHTANLRETGKASVLVIEDESTASNIFARKRAGFTCSTELIERHSEDWEKTMNHFEEKFGKMVDFLKTMEDFHLFRLCPEKGRLVLGFGKAYEVTGKNLSKLQHIGGKGKGHRVEGHRTEKQEVLDEKRIAHMIEHMNDDHADSVLAYAQHFGDRREAATAELLNLNNKEMQIRIDTPSGPEELSIPFSHTLKNGHDAHMTMIKMSKEAKSALEIQST
jgi:putative heme iron utilization protein